MGVSVFKSGFLNSTDESRYLELKAKRENQGLTEAERDEFHLLEDKLKEVK